MIVVASFFFALFVVPPAFVLWCALAQLVRSARAAWARSAARSVARLATSPA